MPENNETGRFVEKGSAVFAMRGHAGPKLHASVSFEPLKVQGRWTVRGPQPVSEEKGCAPQWAYDAMKADPGIEAIAVMRKDGGVVYCMMAEDKQNG